jgi:diguanylate cyclase (GGDEF)-like protein
VFVRSYRTAPGRYLTSGLLTVAAIDEAALTQMTAVPGLLSAALDGHLALLAAWSTARHATEIANRDALTGLGNRRAWQAALHREWIRTGRSGSPLAVFVIDIDGLKKINDTRGHAEGDIVLAKAGEALGALGRITDVVCRLGGDEFGIAAPDTDFSSAQVLAGRVRDSLTKRGVQASVGWAVSSDAESREDLWHQADSAMYREKRSALGTIIRA